MAHFNITQLIQNNNSAIKKPSLLAAMDPIIDMEVDNRLSAATDIPGRWESIQYLLTRGSPLAHPEFEPSEEVCYAMRC